MKIKIRNGTATIEGYVNAVERFSKVLYDTRGKFIEKINPNVFRKALEKNNDVLTLLNHDKDKILARTSDGTSELLEDNIGLRAKVEISDKGIIEKAKKGKLRGWSFGFIENEEERITNKDGLEERTIKDLDLIEVSILDDKKVPAYYGTSIELREDNTRVIEFRSEFDEETEIINEDESKEDKKDLTYNQKLELLNESLRKQEIKEVYICDFNDEYVYARYYEENQVYKIQYSINNDEVQFYLSNKVKVKLEYVEQRADTYKYRNRLSRLKIK